MKIYSNGKMLGVGGGAAQNIYSTEERVVGRWIDGKPAYEKTFVVKNISIPQSASIDVPISLSDYDIDFLIEIQGAAKELPDNISMAVNGHWVCPYLDHTRNVIKITQRISVSAKLFDLYLTLTYTKTTDQATIEIPTIMDTPAFIPSYADAPQSSTAVELEPELITEEV